MSRSWPRVSSAGALGPRAARSSSPTHAPPRLAPAPAAAPEQVSAFLGSSSVPGAEWGGAHTPARRRRRSQSPPTPAPAPPAPPAPKKKSKEPPRRPKGTKQQQQRGESAGAGGRAAAATPGTSCGSSAATESAPAPAPGDAKRKRAAPSAEKPQSRRSERPPTAGPASKPASSKARAKAGAAPAPKKKKKPAPAPADEEPRPPAEDAPPAPTPEAPPEDAAEEALPCRSDSVRELFVATDLYSSGSDAELLSVLSDSRLPSGGKIEALSHSLVEMEEDDDTFHDVADELLGSLQSASAPIDIRMAPRLELDDLELAEIDSDVLCSSMTYGTSVAGNDTISVVIKHIRRQNIKSSGDDIDETSNITDDILTSMCNNDVGSQTDTPHSDESSKMFSASNVDVRVSSRSDEEYESVSCSMITPDTSLIVNEAKQEISPVSDTCEKGDPPFSSDMLFSDQCISAWESDISERSAQDISATPCIHLTDDINVSEHNFLDNQSISLFMSSVSTNNKVEISSNSAVEVQRPLFVNDCENSKTESSTWQIFPSSSVQNTVSNEDKLEMNHVNIYSENTDHIIFRDPSTSDLQNPQDVPRVPNPQSVEPSESEEPPELGNDLFLDASFSVQAKDEESLSTLASDDVCSSSSEEPVSCVSSDYFENALLLISPSTTDHEESTSAIDSSSLHDSKSSPSVSNSGPVPRSAQTTTCSFSFPEDTHPPYLSSHDFACTSGERRGVLGGLMASQRSSTSSQPRSCASEEDGTLRRSSSGGDAPGVRPHARPRAASSHVLCESLDGADDSSTIPICLTGRANVRFSSSKSTSNESQTSVCVFLTSSQSKTSSEDAASALDTAHDVSSSEFFGQASAERLAAAPDRTYSSPQLHDEEVSPRGWAGGRACGSCSSSSVVHLVERAGPGGGRRSAAVLYPSRLLVSDVERQQRMDEWLAQQDVACLEAALRGGGGGGEWAMEAACRYAKFRLRAAGEGVPYFRGCAPGDAPAGRPLAVASAPPHRPSPSRASLAPAEARCGGGAEEVMIVVCCSDSSCADANAGDLAPLSCVRCAGKGWGLPKGEVSRLRSPWYTPDLVSDLPEGCPAALNAAGLRQPRRCGDCRCETWRRAQVLLRRPESAPGPGSGQCFQCVGEDMDAGAGGGGGERIVCAPVKDRIQIFNSVAAAPRSRPVSAQRSVELELGPSTTRVKERILAFNAGVLPAPDASAAPAPAAAAHCQPPPPGPLRGQAHPEVASRAAAAAEGTAPEPGPPPPPPDAPRVSPANSATSLSSSESSREGCALALVADDASELSVDKAALVAHDAGRRCAVSMALAAMAAASLWYAYN